MKRFVRRILAALALLVAGLLVLSIVALARTLTFRSAQLAVEPVAKLDIDDGAIERLAGAIRIPTVSRSENAAPDSAAIEAFHRHLETCFPKVHTQLWREVVSSHSLLFTWKGEDESALPALLMGHMDVVPVEPGTESSWTHAPFSGEVAEGFVWGRGTLDDKASVTAILEAVEVLLSKGFRPKQTTLLAFGHDEELGGQSGAAQIAALMKTRGIRVAYVLDEGSVVTDGIVPGLTSRAALIGIAEKGYASVQLSVASSGGHSSMPPPQTAVGIVAAAVAALERNAMPAQIDGPAALMFDRLGPEMPFGLKFALANRWLLGNLIVRRLEASPTTNAIIRTTTAATTISGGIKDNVLPAHASAVINFRIKPGDTVDKVIAHVTRVVNDNRVKIGLVAPGIPQNPSRQSAVDTPGFRAIERTIRQIMPDVIVAPSLVVGATDTRHYEELAEQVYRFLPCTLKPEDTRRIHGTDERIAVEDYKDCVRFYVQLLVNQSSR